MNFSDGNTKSGFRKASSLYLDQKVTKTRVCDKHGEYTAVAHMWKPDRSDYLWSWCPKCDKLAEEKRRAAERRQREYERKRKVEWIMEHSNIPPRFLDRKIDDFKATSGKQQETKDFCRQYVDEFEQVVQTGRSAVFLGKPGTGKTHLAIAMLLEVVNRHCRSGIYMTVSRLIRHVRSAWKDGKTRLPASGLETGIPREKGNVSAEDAIIGFYSDYDLLVLDEVGVQYGTDSERIIIFELLNARYEKRKPTIMIGNCSLDELKTYLGERVIDRLREDGGRLLVFDWKSHRGK